MTQHDRLPRAAYVHVPFCAHRCGYCSFTLVAGRDDLAGDYLRAIELELQGLGAPREVDTLFFGGGTPTHLKLADLDRLFRTVLQWFVPSAGFELSVEANPLDVTPQLVEILARHGVTRVSLGAQSFDPDKLRVLERDHLAADNRRAVDLLRPRIPAVSLDLIFAAPGETLSGWQADLAQAMELKPEHVSTYGLTFERGALFYNRLSKGTLGRADEEVERSMYAAAIDTLAAAGFEHYEVSNFALPGRRCRHNEAYWAGDEYYAVGPGAARYVQGRREINHRSTTTYLKRMLAGLSPVAESEQLNAEDRARETLVFGLRRMAGVERADFAARTGYALNELVREPLARLVSLGLLVDDGRRVRLTREGLFVSDALWPHFLRT